MSDLPENIVNQDDLRGSFAFHEVLNPKLWHGNKMRLDVRVALLRGAEAFVSFLDVPGLVVQDVIFTGSNAAFNYTAYSDLDVHVVVDYEESACPDLAENFFTTKKSLWNQTHQISVKGYGVEMYVEDTANPVTALGVYSLLRGEWVREPKADRKPSWNDSAVAAKVEAMAEEIEAVLAGEIDRDEIDALMDRIRKMRKAGLQKAGEFSTENLAFKGLRNLGYIERLWKARIDAEDRTLSLEAERDGPR